MKTKISRILGVGLTVAMLASMLVIANPMAVSAGTLTPSNEFSPPTRPGSDVIDFAIAPNGTTIYAAGGTTDLVSDIIAGGKQLLAKSTNGGTSWSAAATPQDPIPGNAGLARGNADWPGNLPTDTVGARDVILSVTAVAVAPDTADGSWVAIVASDNTSGTPTPTIYVSQDGSTTWNTIGTPQPVGVTTPMINVRDIAVAGPAGTATHSVIVVGDNGAGVAKVWLWEQGGLTGGWTDVTVSGAGVGTWNATDFNSTGTSAWAVKFSPNYAADRTFAVVTSDGTNTRLQLANTNSKVWNGVQYGLGNTTTAGLKVERNTLEPSGVLGAASLALAPTFFGQDASSRVAYVGLAATYSGVFRISGDNVSVLVKRLSTLSTNSVAVNAAGDKLVAGAFASNDVVRVVTPATATEDAGVSATGLKRPGLDDPIADSMVLVGFAGTNVVAGTKGSESAFSRSANDGMTFNDVSLVDSSSVVPIDFAISADGSKIYVAAWDSNGKASIWRKTTAWERVLVITPNLGTTDYTINVAPENADIVYFAERNSTNASQIYYSNDGGQTTWQLRVATRVFSDMAIESATTVYALAGNAVLKSTDSGFLWDVNPVQNMSFTTFSIAVLSTGNVIVGGTGGQVAYSSNNTWTTIGPAVPGVGKTFVASSGLASGNFIFATTSGSGEVYRWTVGTSTAWTAMMESGSLTTELGVNTPATPAGTSVPTGIAYAGGTLYVVTDAASGGPASPNVNITTSDVTRLYRVLAPNTTTKFEDWSLIRLVDTTSPGSSVGTPVTVRLQADATNGRNGFSASVGSDGNPKIWGISRGHSNPAADGFTPIVTAGSASNQLTSLVDALTKTSPAMTGPADKFDVQMNVQTGQANNVVFTWTAPAGVPATATYNVQIALDANFTQIVYGAPGSVFVPVTGTTFIVGQGNANTSTTGLFPFQADVTYYWRVRVMTLGGIETLTKTAAAAPAPAVLYPFFSTTSAARSFKIGSVTPLAIQAPAPGAQNVPVKPTFVWSPVAGATTYEIVVSDDPTFKIITFSRTTDRPNFASDEQLAFGTVYYWRVRASAPAGSVTQFANGIFTTEGKAGTTTGTPTATVPPITVTNVTPTFTVELGTPVEAIPAYLLWIIIGIGAILVIALIVLIVRTRRVS